MIANTGSLAIEKLLEIRPHPQWEHLKNLLPRTWKLWIPINMIKTAFHFQQLQNWLDEDMELEEYKALVKMLAIPEPHKFIPRTRINRGRADGHTRLYNDYFALPSKYTDMQFARRFRMSREMVVMLCERLQAPNPFWVQKPVSVKEMFLSRFNDWSSIFWGCLWCSLNIYATEGHSLPPNFGNRLCSWISGLVCSHWQDHSSGHPQALHLRHTCVIQRGFPLSSKQRSIRNHYGWVWSSRFSWVQRKCGWYALDMEELPIRLGRSVSRKRKKKNHSPWSCCIKMLEMVKCNYVSDGIQTHDLSQNWDTY